MDENAIVRVESLSKRFANRVAVDGLSFEVRGGELFGIAGPDGAGKTTLLRMLAGILVPSSGDATLGGTSVVREPERVKRAIAYMPQRFGLYGDLTVLENIDFYADLYESPRATRAETIERLFHFSGLGSFRDRLAAKLSGGMKQKLGLSCALIHEPEILLLDEPTFGVDPISRRDLWVILHEMVARGVTIVVTTSYLDEAERFDRVAFLDEGKLLALDAPDGLLASIRGETLAVRTPRPRDAKEIVGRLPFVRSVVVFGGEIHVEVGNAASDEPKLREALRGLDASEPVTITPTLEAAFIERLRFGAPASSPAGPPASGRHAESDRRRDAGAPIVTASDLTRKFGEFVAVDRVSFEIARGEIFGFLGPNGAGKTTTIKMLAGLLLPTSGSGRVAGHDLFTGSERIKESLGYMSQAFSLYTDLTVVENIDFFAGLYGVPRARRAERRQWVLDAARLAEHRDRMVGELSLGWKQRLALGCAVLHEPPLLFLDEPTSGVDPISRRNFWDLIQQLAAKGTTIFVTTHYMAEAEFCDRLALMNRGAIIALDTPAKIRTRLRRPLVEIVTSDSVRALRVLSASGSVAQAGLFGRAIHATVDDDRRAIREVPELLAKHDIATARIARIEPSLEDVFVALVEEAGGTVDA